MAGPAAEPAARSVIPRKIVEWTFLRLPLLVLSIVIAPALVLLARLDDEPEYRSDAVVWVADTPGLGSIALGSNSPFISAPQRHAGVINDLLRTQRFREEAAIAAGLVSPEDEAALRGAASLIRRSVSVRGAGQNILFISATTFDPGLSMAVLTGVIAE